MFEECLQWFTTCHGSECSFQHLLPSFYLLILVYCINCYCGCHEFMCYTLPHSYQIQHRRAQKLYIIVRLENWAINKISKTFNLRAFCGILFKAGVLLDEKFSRDWRFKQIFLRTYVKTIKNRFPGAWAELPIPDLFSFTTVISRQNLGAVAPILWETQPIKVKILDELRLISPLIWRGWARAAAAMGDSYIRNFIPSSVHLSGSA